MQTDQGHANCMRHSKTLIACQQAYRDAGTLTHLDVAFSRPQEGPGQYVQDRMRLAAAELLPLIQHPSAHIYVCGDGSQMAKDVDACLRSILVHQGNLNVPSAASFLSSMSRDHRYVRDIWS